MNHSYEIHRAQIETILRALHDGAEEEHQTEQKDYDAICADHNRRPSQKSVVGNTGDEEDDECRRYPDELFIKKGIFRRE